MSQKNNAVEVFRGNLTRMQGEFKLVLPEGVTPEKFTRVVMTAVQSSPHLLPYLNNDEGQKAMIAASMRCAQDGLMPDNREAAFVAFNGKPQYMPMIGGVRKKILGTGMISGIPAHVVYENDHFIYELGDNERLEHIPVLKDRGEAIAVYAIAIFKDGYREREVMTVEDVNKVRDCSAAKNGPWGKWWDQMAIKTVVKRLAKRLPLDDSASAVIESDNQQFIDVTATPEPTHTAADFDRMAAERGDSVGLAECLALSAKNYGMTVDDFKAQAAANFDDFWTAFENWKAKSAQPDPAPRKPKKDAAPAPVEDTRPEVSCPNKTDSEGTPLNVLTTYCQGKPCKADCPSWKE